MAASLYAVEVAKSPLVPGVTEKLFISCGKVAIWKCISVAMAAVGALPVSALLESIKRLSES